MKKSLLTVTVVAGLLFLNCNKNTDLITPTEGGVSTPVNNSMDAEPDMEAKRLMMQSITELQQLSDQEYVARALEIKEDLKSPQKVLKDGEEETEVPITEIFYLYEGVLNHNYSDIYATIQDVESASSNHTIEFHTDSAGDYFVYASDLADFIDELEDEIELEIDTASQEVLTLLDLNLVSLNGSNGTATINMNIFSSIGSLFQTPASPVYGAELAGWCSTGQGNVDGATFLNIYANANAPHKLNNPCPSGQNPFPIALIPYQTFTDDQLINPANQNPTFWNNNVYKNVWKSNSNVCMGYSNNEWYTWYDKMDDLMNLQLSYAQSIDPNAQFILTDYHSHDKNDPGENWDGAERYYHGGMFVYGVVICI